MTPTSRSRPPTIKRFQSWYSQGPEGIFLKQDAAGAPHFGKAYVYGWLARCLRALGLNGLLAFNLLCLALTMAVGYWWLSPGGRRLPSLAASIFFATAAITPLYAAWLTSDLMNYTLVFLAFATGWRRPGEAGVTRARAITAAIILAAATFSKPLNALQAVALAVGAGPTWRAWARSLTVFAIVVPALFGINARSQAAIPTTRAVIVRPSTRIFRTTTMATCSSRRASRARPTRWVDLPARTGRVGTFPQNLRDFVAGRHFGVLPFAGRGWWPWCCGR